MRASSVRTDVGSITSTVSPQPANCTAMEPGVCAATRTRARPSDAVDSTSQCRPKCVRSTGASRDSIITVADTRPRRPSISSTTVAQVTEFEIGRPLRDDLGDQHVLHPVDPERPLAACGPGHQIPDVVLVDEAPGVHRPGRALVRSAGVGEIDLPPRDDGGLEDVHQCGPCPIAVAPSSGVDHDGVGSRLRIRPEGRR